MTEPLPTIDTSRLGRLAAELMERVEEEFGSEAELETVGVVVEVRHPDPDGGEATTITCASSDPRAWVQSALFDFAARLTGNYERRE